MRGSVERRLNNDRSWDLGGAVFCNPPYGCDIGKWVQKAYKEAQRRRRIVTKIILVMLVIAATLTECIVMRKSREYDAADNIAGIERCVKAMVVLGLVGIAAAVACVAA